MVVIPPALAAMVEYHQWICWQLVQKPGQPKLAKVPTDPRTHFPINAQDPKTWITAADATIAANATGLGVGFVFTESDPFFFLDIDECAIEHTNGHKSWASHTHELIFPLRGAAVETSISGKGLHVFGRCSRDFPHSNRNAKLGAELYTSKRFAALGTGAVGDAGLDCTVGLLLLAAQYFPPHTSVGVGEWTTEAVAGHGFNGSDGELIATLLERSRDNHYEICGRPSFREIWTRNETALSHCWPDPHRSFDESRADYALALKLAYYTGGNCERVEHIMLQCEALRRDKWDARRDDYLRHQTIQKAVTYKIGQGKLYQPPPPPPIFTPPPPRPQIILTNDDLQLLEAACTALRDCRSDLYRVGNPGGGACVQLDAQGTCDLNETMIEAVLSHEIDWRRAKKTKTGYQLDSARPPTPVAKLLSTGWGSLPLLRGVSTLPVLRLDGTIYSAPGYDDVSGMVLRCDPMLASRIRSTQADAIAALHHLLGAVDDAPWFAPSDAYCWIAHILTVAGRNLVDGPAPLWVYSATQTGSGKTALATAAVWVPTGHRVEAVASSFDAQTIARRIGPHADDPGVTLDNVTISVIRSPELESWLTSGVCHYDLKYANAVSRPLRAVVTITANGARLGRDLAQRSVPVRLAPVRGHVFRRGELLDALEPHRDQLACDALTILRAWLMAGAPPPPSTLPRFAPWAHVVCGALHWLTGVDLAKWIEESREDLDVDDEGADDIVQAFAAWLVANEVAEATSGEIAAPVEPSGDMASMGARSAARVRLLAVVANRRNTRPDNVDAGAVGLIFASSTQWTEHGRLANRRSHGQRLWRVERS